LSTLLGFVPGFVLGTILEVRVEAQSIRLREIDIKAERLNETSSSLLEEPARCLDQPAPCAVQTGASRKLVLKRTNGIWTLADKTIAILVSSQQFRFVEGMVRVQSSDQKPTKVSTDHGEFEIRGDVFLERRGDRLTLVNLGSHPAFFRGRGWGQNKEVPSGLQAEFDLPDIRDGQTVAALPVPIDFESQAIREARLFEGDKKAFQERLNAVAETRAEGAAIAAAIHKAVAERRVASVQAADAERRQARAKQEEKNRKIRDLFRKKALPLEQYKNVEISTDPLSP
jgi:hypothetical protein